MNILDRIVRDRVLKPGRTAYYQKNLDSGTYSTADEPVVAHPDSANLIGSSYGLVEHLPVIDIDVPCVLVESSTPGHYHLYIDHPVVDELYWQMLEAMAAAGVVQKAYVGVSKRRGQTFVRVPGLKKRVPGLKKR